MKVVVALVTIGAAWGAAGLEAQDFKFDRNLAEGQRFALRNIVGDVRVEGTSGRTVQVEAVKREGRYGNADDVEIRAVEIDGGVAICVYYPGQYSRSDRRRNDRDDREDRDDRDNRRNRNRDNNVCHRDGRWSSNERNDTRVDFVIKVPTGLRLDLKTVSGDVWGRNLRGSIDLATVSGHLELIDATADVLEASSVSGSVDLEGISAREVSAETVSGNVNYAGSIEGRGSYDFKTLSGNVLLTLPKQPDARVSANTFSGRVRSEFPLEQDTRRRRNRASGTWGNGGAQLDLESFSGNITIRTTR
ncbi:MAG: DUF4097 family beta strand repeat protein [Gemmatimonadales bacterium]|nr:DUF4097 family beta strand repeat protein [Gemmatimonadales bacterium]